MRKILFGPLLVILFGLAGCSTLQPPTPELPQAGVENSEPLPQLTEPWKQVPQSELKDFKWTINGKPAKIAVWTTPATTMEACRVYTEALATYSETMGIEYNWNDRLKLSALGEALDSPESLVEECIEYFDGVDTNYSFATPTAHLIGEPSTGDVQKTWDAEFQEDKGDNSGWSYGGYAPPNSDLVLGSSTDNYVVFAYAPKNS